nr:MAG TPA: hypothetical protein [Caudoviricetes sp.]
MCGDDLESSPNWEQKLNKRLECNGLIVENTKQKSQQEYKRQTKYKSEFLSFL